MPELSKEDEVELADHMFASEASRVMAAVLARCIRFTERCDEQMTARMQRKNRQVKREWCMLLPIPLTSCWYARDDGRDDVMTVCDFPARVGLT